VVLAVVVEVLAVAAVVVEILAVVAGSALLWPAVAADKVRVDKIRGFVAVDQRQRNSGCRVGQHVHI
jgi:hypothetical protein